MTEKRKNKGHYAEKRDLFLELANIVENMGSNEISIPKLLYELTLKYATSEKTILSRIFLLEEIGLIQIKDNIITRKVQNGQS